VLQQSVSARTLRSQPAAVSPPQPLNGRPVLSNSQAAPKISAAPLQTVQRQFAHSSRTSPVNPNVPSDKWRTDVEYAYRRSGMNDIADAVKNCRELGQCGKLLTTKEAWDAYRSGRITANLGEPPERGPARNSTSGVAMAGVVAPATALSAPQAAAAKTALERAAVRWGTATVIEGGAAAAVPAAEAGAGAAAASGTAAGVSTVAVPIAVGVVVVLAIADLIGYARFEIALRALGYVILPEPLGVCISGCHQPSAPPRNDPFPFRDFEPQLPPPEDWFKRTTPRPTPAPRPGPKPTIDPFPGPDLEEEKKKRKRSRYPIYWPVALHFPTTSEFVRVKSPDRDYAGDNQKALKSKRTREDGDPDFQSKRYHIHHVVPLFLGGEDKLQSPSKGGNGIILPAMQHISGHAQLQMQPQMQKPPPPLPPLDVNIYKHPVGTPYFLAGFKLPGE
jgi:hypothetical protein